MVVTKTILTLREKDFSISLRPKAFSISLRPKAYSITLNIVVQPPITPGFPYTFPYNLA